MNLSLKPRRFNGDMRTCFFPWILKQVHTITQNKFTHLHICTVQTGHSHCRATQTERHILILVWFLRTAYHLILTNPKKAYSHQFRGHWALLQVCLHTDAHPHMLPSSHPQTPPPSPILVHPHSKIHTLRFMWATIAVAFLLFPPRTTATKYSLLQTNL